MVLRVRIKIVSMQRWCYIGVMVRVSLVLGLGLGFGYCLGLCRNVGYGKSSG